MFDLSLSRENWHPKGLRRMLNDVNDVRYFKPLRLFKGHV